MDINTRNYQSVNDFCYDVSPVCNADAKDFVPYIMHVIGARWSSGQYAQRTIAEAKHRS
jgi:hypothetical protein